MTRASEGIALGCFAVLGVALVFGVLGLRTRRSGPNLAVVALAAALVVLGTVIAGVVDLRFGAISSIYGLEGPGSPDLFGSWALVGLAGDGMAAAGYAGLVIAATVAIVRRRTASRGPSRRLPR